MKTCQRPIPFHRGRCGTRTRLLILSVQGITAMRNGVRGFKPFPLFHAGLPLYSGFSFLYLNSFMSSYSPLAIFIAIWCCG